MKKADIGIIAVVLLAAIMLWLVPRIGMLAGQEAAELQIRVDGQLYKTYSLEKDQIISIGHTNVCRIKEGKVKMTEADCQDHLCMRQKEISGIGGSIVCLPNRVVLEIKNIQEDGLDAAAR